MEGTIGESIGALGMVLGFFGIGVLGTYFSVKDKVIISSGPGATFDLYWKYFAVWAVIGGLIGGAVGMMFGWVINLIIDNIEAVVILGIGAYIYFFEDKKKEEPSSETDGNTNLTETKK